MDGSGFCCNKEEDIMSKLPISVCIIAKNEEKYMEECLKRLMPYGFEVIVTDTGSTDNTKEIALQYADKVLDFEWIKDFSAARNFCAAHAANNWILALDCDEYVNNVDVSLLRMAVQKYPRHVGMLQRRNIVLWNGGKKGYVSDDTPRFYNRNFYTFAEPIHEQIVYIDAAKRDGTLHTFTLPIDVTHHGYALTEEEKVQKQNRNLELLLAQLQEKPDNPYINYQIGQSYYMLEEAEKALPYYQKALDCLKEVSADMFYSADTVISIASIYLEQKRTAEAVSLLEKYAPSCQSALYYYAFGNAYLDNGQPLKALLVYIKTTAMKDAEALGDRLGNCYGKIIKIAQQIGEYDTANLFTAQFEHYMAEKERILENQA